MCHPLEEAKVQGKDCQIPSLQGHAEEWARPEAGGNTREHGRKLEPQALYGNQAAAAPLRLAALAMRGGGPGFWTP